MSGNGVMTGMMEIITREARGETQEDQEVVVKGFSVAVVGATALTTAVRLLVSGTSRTSGTTTLGFVVSEVLLKGLRRGKNESI